MTSTFSLKVHLPPEFGDVELIQSICDDRKQQFPTTATAAPANRVQIESTSGERHPSRMTAVPIVRCDYVQLSPTPSITFENSLSRLAAVFCPSALVDTALEQVQQKNQRLPDVAVSGHPSMYSKVEWVDSRKNLSQILLSLIHPFLSKNFTIQAILAFKHDNGVTNKSNNSGDIVIVNLSHCPYATIVDDLFDSTNCEVIHSGPEAILKILLLSNLEFLTFRDIAPMESLARETTAMIDSRTTNDTLIEVPTCAVCLHRIEPSRLGLPRPRSHHLCSKFCPPPNFSLGNNTAPSCPRQRLLQPWAPPDYCDACHVIWNYWRKCDILSATIKTLVSDNDSNVFCTYCGMQETLWVCLTCGFVGCGRYSNKHAAGHNNETHHPFCLELSTLRIWSYVHGEFVHRLDTLECPSSLQHLQHLPFIESGGEAASRIFVRSDASTATLATVAAHSASVRSDTNEEVTSKYAILSPPYSTHNTADSSIQILVDYNRIISSSFASVNEKTPKKATMIGEEYEVLLQSALEDQAQFYEGEITWLRATLTAQQVDQKTITTDEALEIENLGSQINVLRLDIDRAGRELLDAQALEAGHRATSKRLLREQTSMQELLRKIRDEAAIEREQGQVQIEELELQIDDLKTNQRMMHHFSQDEDLKNSQIFGAEQQTCQFSKPTTKKGKKIRKFFRR